MSSLGIETISVFGLPPVAFVEMAAKLGCRHISTGLTSFDAGVCNYPPFSLRDDATLRRDMLAAMRDTGVSISLGEGLNVRPETDVGAYARDLDLFAELGVARINTVSMDPDRARSLDQFAALAGLAAEREMVTTVELVPALTIADLPAALDAIRHVARPDFRLLIDTMHFARSGGTAGDLGALDPALIDYVQVSDVPRVSRFTSYFEEAMFERMVPGEGELDLLALCAVLPTDRVYALELPLRGEATAGIGPHERLGKAVAATRRLLVEAREARP